MSRRIPVESQQWWQLGYCWVSCWHTSKYGETPLHPNSPNILAQCPSQCEQDGILQYKEVPKFFLSPWNMNHWTSAPCSQHQQHKQPPTRSSFTYRTILIYSAILLTAKSSSSIWALTLARSSLVWISLGASMDLNWMRSWMPSSKQERRLESSFCLPCSLSTRLLFVVLWPLVIVWGHLFLLCIWLQTTGL
jgi:hypothetical protein